MPDSYRACVLRNRQFSQTKIETRHMVKLVVPDGSSGRCQRLSRTASKVRGIPNIMLSYSDQIAPAKGLSHGGKITLLSGMQPAEEFSTLAHEIAHL
jgi:hypothetical protein